MRLKEYHKYWSQLYETNMECAVNEIFDLKTKVNKKSKNEWYFWVDKDLYTVKTVPINKDTYHISFAYKDYFDNEVSSITDKQTPFRVLDGVIVVIKNLIEEENPKIIEFDVFNIDKKIDLFRKTTKLIIKRYNNIFGNYKLTEKKVKLPYKLPDDVSNIEGIRFRLSKE